MALPDTDITFSAIQAQFGGSNPIGLTEYYAGGLYVAGGTLGLPAGGSTPIPSSGQISVGNFMSAPYTPWPGFWYGVVESSGQSGFNTFNGMSVDITGHFIYNIMKIGFQWNLITYKNDANTARGFGRFSRVSDSSFLPGAVGSIDRAGDLNSGTLQFQYMALTAANDNGSYRDWDVVIYDFVGGSIAGTPSQKRLTPAHTGLFGGPNVIVRQSGSNTSIGGSVMRVSSGSATVPIIMMCDSTGAISWARTLINTNPDQSPAISNISYSRDGGNIYTVGRNYTTGQKSFISKHNPSGVAQWVKDIGSADDKATDVVSDSSGNSYVAVVHSSLSATTLMKIDTSGAIAWQKELAVGNISDSVLCLDTAGTNVYLGVGGYLYKFNSSGVLQYERLISANVGSSYIHINGLAISFDNTAVHVATVFHTLYPTGSTYSAAFNLPTDGSRSGNVIALAGTSTSSFTDFGITYSTPSSTTITTGTRAIATTTLTEGDASSYITTAAGTAGINTNATFSGTIFKESGIY